MPKVKLSLSLERLEQEACHEVEASLGYIVRPCFKTKSEETIRIS